MDIYVFAVGILFAVAILDLMVGVSNDAVNFLNSSVGSRVAPRHTIMIVASLGILAGVTFSSGMMEVARKGIFHPQFFVMLELITIFLAVMITDILLLDLFNTFGLPTSTTVSIVFELLGAAIAVSIVKITQIDQSMMTLLTRINILKPIVLTGTFALAMAFAANDLVNFIGVPLAGFHTFALAKAATDPLTVPMAALQQKIHTNTFFLLAAGAIMVATLWLSRKARTVTKTEVNLGRQEEGLERFDSSQLSRIVVRMATRMIDAIGRICPKPLRLWTMRRFDSTNVRPVPGYDGSIPEFDLLRASVNLMVASALVSWATSMKLPLSTTYVTFMVAMGSSLADQAWGLESAVFRVTGVLTVIGGWFFTALSAFTVALTFAFILTVLNKWAAILLLLTIAGLMIYRNFRIHGLREKAASELELLDLKRVTSADFAVRTCFEHSGSYLNVIRGHLSRCFDGILTQNRKQLKRLRRETSKVQSWSNIIVANIFKTMRLLQHEDAIRAGKYAYVISALQEISESLRDLILRCHVHTSNQHSGLLPAQKKELQQVRKCVEGLLDETARILLNRQPFNYGDVARNYVELKQLLEEFDRHQIDRIRSSASKTRLSILLYGITNACLKISEQTLQLLTIFDETFHLEGKPKT
jgi:phosphate/sulfate permease